MFSENRHLTYELPPYHRSGVCRSNVPQPEEEEEEEEEQEGTGGHWPHCDYFHNIARNTIAIIKVDGFCVTQSCFVVFVTKNNNNKITFHTNGFYGSIPNEVAWHVCLLAVDHLKDIA